MLVQQLRTYMYMSCVMAQMLINQIKSVVKRLNLSRHTCTCRRKQYGAINNSKHSLNEKCIINHLTMSTSLNKYDIFELYILYNNTLFELLILDLNSNTNVCNLLITLLRKMQK